MFSLLMPFASLSQQFSDSIKDTLSITPSLRQIEAAAKFGSLFVEHSPFAIGIAKEANY